VLLGELDVVVPCPLTEAVIDAGEFEEVGAGG
jgi:hypothetical protein